MTIHKSKGLEYHSVIFVGLDDGAWWSFAGDQIEARRGSSSLLRVPSSGSFSPTAQGAVPEQNRDVV
jgi:ATP-dependent exoDNAse (exonuclease V) beta subunit